ncbi:unnamed protein product [Plutella xylostella]|uniref:(diamondback moth) hypothetical protein n=1 Tax=Plutella xylostella TaxID=51655 RepID=A0A8S4DTS9_PLUXY|nr:unnamed protein product [Plutella xylostella]
MSRVVSPPRPAPRTPPPRAPPPRSSNCLIRNPSNTKKNMEILTGLITILAESSDI